MLLGFIPDSIVLAGLVGCVAALIVAWGQQKWELKVLLLLALRLAIGWHFFFEGLHKINTHLVGVTETNKPFSSEPYFKVAPTAFGEIMRGKFVDPAAVIADRVKPKQVLTKEAFLAQSEPSKAMSCPDSVIDEFDKLAESANAYLKDQIEKVKIRGEAEAAKATSEELKKHAVWKSAEEVKALEEKLNDLSKITPQPLEAAKVKYAEWVYGVKGRDAKIKQVNDPVPLTAPQRLKHIETEKAMIVEELRKAAEKHSAGLGLKTPAETKRTTDLRADLLALDADLAKDANAFVVELKKEILGWEYAPKVKSQGDRIDEFTMWFICVVGAAIFFGFCTRISCVLAAFFLVMTYLTHPPFPWYTLPPGTEGNPLFVNKNAIECLALLVLACYPTGRWLGLDAVLHRLFHSRGYLAQERQNQIKTT